MGLEGSWDWRVLLGCLGCLVVGRLVTKNRGIVAVEVEGIGVTDWIRGSLSHYTVPYDQVRVIRSTIIPDTVDSYLVNWSSMNI